MKYKTTILLDLAPQKTGLLIPVFKIDESNLPFVQEMNEGFDVFDMQPYLFSDNYEYCIPPRIAETDVGEKGIIAFRSFDGEIFVGDISDVLLYRDKNMRELSSSPLLDLQLARICGEQLPAIYPKWQQVSKDFFGEREATRWSSGEHALFQRNSGIWKDIASERPTEEHYSILEEFNSHSFEYLFKWLVDNPTHRQWSRVWIHAFKMRPFDERIYYVAQHWLRTEMNDHAFISDIRLILFAYLERQSLSKEKDQDFSEVLTEYLFDLDEERHELLYPTLLPAFIFQNLDVEQFPSFTISLLVYFRDRLSEDRRYADTLFSIKNTWKRFVLDHSVELEEAIKDHEGILLEVGQDDLSLFI